MFTASHLLAEPNGVADFARANGWRYERAGDPPALGTSLWEQVSNGTAHDQVFGPGWEVGHLTGGSRTASVVEQRGRWTVSKSVSFSTSKNSIDLGYLAITLPRRLPQMILDARGNDRGPFSSLLHEPVGSQRLSLEGDFDTHFRLYVPAGYERDALYVFTPDLMALLIDETGDLDVEIRDDRLIVYRPGGFELRSPATWERFERIRATVGAKAWDRTDRYVDERTGQAPALQFDGGDDRGVDASGRRLRTRNPMGGLFGIVIAGLVLGGLGVVAAIVAVVLALVHGG